MNKGNMVQESTEDSLFRRFNEELWDDIFKNLMLPILTIYHVLRQPPILQHLPLRSVLLPDLRNPPDLPASVRLSTDHLRGMQNSLSNQSSIPQQFIPHAIPVFQLKKNIGKSIIADDTRQLLASVGK